MLHVTRCSGRGPHYSVDSLSLVAGLPPPPPRAVSPGQLMSPVTPLDLETLLPPPSQVEC